MKKNTLFILLLLAVPIFMNAQRKSDLIAEIENIKDQRDSIRFLLREAEKNEKVSMTRMESAEAQLGELRDANTLLLQNLKMFTEASSKKSESIGNTLESLREKEGQLKTISDALGSHDSTAIIALTNAKQTLGENARIGVSQGTVIISESLTNLFADATTSDVSSTANDFLGKIANILTANPEMAITVEGLSMTGELDLAIKQAASLAGVLQKEFSIAPERITVIGKDGNFKEGINFRMHPNFQNFYITIREKMKNGN